MAISTLNSVKESPRLLVKSAVNIKDREVGEEPENHALRDPPVAERKSKEGCAD